jgi:hypothetical protein
LEILGIAFVEGDEAGMEWLREFKEKHRVNWPTVATGNPAWFSEPFEKYNVSYLPFYLLLDNEGRVIEIDPRGARLDRTLARLFGDDTP